MAGWLETAPGWVASLPEGLQTLLFQLYQTFVYQDRWTWYVDGLKVTFLVTIGALILGIIIGMLIAVSVLRMTRSVRASITRFWVCSMPSVRFT